MIVSPMSRPACRDGADPFAPTAAGGCLDLQKASTGGGGHEQDLFDIAANPAPCPGIDLCRHILTFHTVFEIPAAGGGATTAAATRGPAPVLLGDLSTYASLSGYRFRLVAADATQVIVVGQPGETVEVTYLLPANTTASGFLTRVQKVMVGSDGRRQITMQ